MNRVKFLVIQTAFIGDAILASALLEKLKVKFPEAQIDFFIRKGNESLYQNHPFINKLYVWNKKERKFKNLLNILNQVRIEKYDYLINLQRFASTGLFTVFSGSKQKIGFRKNPFSFLFTRKIDHSISNGKHEVERNQLLIEHLTDSKSEKPKLYPSMENFEKVRLFKDTKYICISPASVWFTKQFPKQKWIEFIDQCDNTIRIYLLGAPGDFLLCNEIIGESKNKNIENLAGKLSLLDSAALMKDALWNYTNDSAPMHIASAVNAKITAIFCSTIPAFGFGPLSTESRIVEVRDKLNCRPCGLHGKKFCPEGHFKCAFLIDVQELVSTITG